MDTNLHKLERPLCSACGTSPQSHRILFFIDFLGTYCTPFDRVFDHLPFLKRAVKKAEHFLTQAIVGLFSFLGLATFNRDPERAVSGRSRLIWDEALARGIAIEQVVFLKKPLEQYRARLPQARSWIYFESIPIPYHLAKPGYDWRVDDKLLLAEDLHRAGIRVPQARTVYTLSGARKAFAELAKPVIVKPRNGTRGRHTTTNIRTEEELAAAIKLCQAISTRMVVEEHLFGSVYRATVIGNKLVGFFRADPPQVTGDGTSSVEQLVAEKNKSKPELIGEISITEDTHLFLARQGLSITSVIPRGTTIDLSAKTGRFYGGYTREMFPEIHPGFHQHFEKAAQVMGSPVIGFDAIVEDPRKDPDTQKWGIIEGNSLPFIDLHQFAYEGTPRNIAPYIWDLWTSEPR